MRRSLIAAVALMLTLAALLLGGMGYIAWTLFTTPEEVSVTFPPMEDAAPTQEPQGNREQHFRLVNATLTDPQGETVALSTLSGRPVVLLFWSSWCEDCKAYLTQGMAEAAQSARDSGAAFLLVCREGIRDDTRQTAESVLAQYGITESTWMDEGAALYHSLGLYSVPSIAVLDSQGRLMHTTTRMPDASAMQDLLAYAAAPQAQTSQLLTSLQGEDGLLSSSYQVIGGQLRPGDTVLSETQGLMMLWAVHTNNQPLFDQLCQGVNTSLTENGLTAWQSINGKAGQVNAALDDLRIIEALALADAQWGGYAAEAAARAQSLYNICVRNGYLRNFAALNGSTISEKISLCYMDAAAMSSAAAYDPRWESVARQAAALLQNPDALISPAFPLYYPAYDAASGTFTGDRLPMSEAMVAVLNAVRAGADISQTLDWLASALDAGVIYACYTLDGQVAPGYRYESTATYALLVQIGVAAGREDITLKALERMERQRCFDAPLLGGYGSISDNPHYTFDALEALLAWQALNW